MFMLLLGTNIQSIKLRYKEYNIQIKEANITANLENIQGLVFS